MCCRSWLRKVARQFAHCVGLPGVAWRPGRVPNERPENPSPLANHCRSKLQQLLCRLKPRIIPAPPAARPGIFVWSAGYLCCVLTCVSAPFVKVTFEWGSVRDTILGWAFWTVTSILACMASKSARLTILFMIDPQLGQRASSRPQSDVWWM